MGVPESTSGVPDGDAPFDGALVPSLDAVSEERRAAALRAVDPQGNWLSRITRSGYPTFGYQEPEQRVVNLAALSPELSRKIAALRDDDLYELVDGIRVGKTYGTASPVPLDHLRFGWRDLDRLPIDGAPQRHQRYATVTMLTVNTVLNGLVVFAGLCALVYVLRGSAPTAEGMLALAAVSGLPAAGAAWFAPMICGGPARERQFTEQDRAEVVEALVTVAGSSPEGRLSRYAQDLAESITASPAWASEVLAAQRAGFDPRAIADQARTHAANIADLRAQIGAVSADGDLPEQVAARASLEYEAKLLDAMVETLRYRVAGLWLYNESITDLSKRVTAMTALEGSIARVQRLEGAAQQMGSDILAASELAARAADLDAVRAQVDILVQGLAATLGMTITPELPAANTDDR